MNGKDRKVTLIENSWHVEANRLRQNFIDDSAAVSALIDLFEEELEHMSPLLCLALHHVAMRFHSFVGPATIRKFKGANLQDLPEAIYPADRQFTEIKK